MGGRKGKRRETQTVSLFVFVMRLLRECFFVCVWCFALLGFGWLDGGCFCVVIHSALLPFLLTLSLAL